MIASYGIWMIISSLTSAILGGGAIYLFTLKSKKKEAAATARNTEALADGSELNNVEKAIKIWRDMAEKLATELEEQRKKSDELKSQLDKLTKEVSRLSCINNKILTLLDKITPENIEQTVGEMKLIIGNEKK